MNKASEELSSIQVHAVFSSLVHGPHPALVKSDDSRALVPGLKIICVYNPSTPHMIPPCWYFELTVLILFLESSGCLGIYMSTCTSFSRIKLFTHIIIHDHDHLRWSPSKNSFFLRLKNRFFQWILCWDRGLQPKMGMNIFIFQVREHYQYSGKNCNPRYPEGTKPSIMRPGPQKNFFGNIGKFRANIRNLELEPNHLVDH